MRDDEREHLIVIPEYTWRRMTDDEVTSRGLNCADPTARWFTDGVRIQVEVTAATLPTVRATCSVVLS